MKRIALAAALAATSASFALAADLGTKKPSALPPLMTTFNWTGAYVGIDGGYITGRVNTFVPGVPASGNFSTSGFTPGAHAGYRYQLQNNVVLGAEARAFINFGTRKSKDYPGFPGTAQQVEGRWGGDARLSVGYAIDRFLPYLTAGLAIGDARGCVRVFGTPCFPGTSISDTRIGWTVGAGVAYAFTNALIARVDYAYSDFGSKNYTTPGLPGGTIRVKLETHALRAGLSYKF